MPSLNVPEVGAQKLGLADAEQMIELLDRRDRCLAHADRADLVGSDQHHFGAAWNDEAAQRRRRHPPCGSAADDDDPVEAQPCHRTFSIGKRCPVLTAAAIRCRASTEAIWRWQERRAGAGGCRARAAGRSIRPPRCRLVPRHEPAAFGEQLDVLRERGGQAGWAPVRAEIVELDEIAQAVGLHRGAAIVQADLDRIQVAARPKPDQPLDLPANHAQRRRPDRFEARPLPSRSQPHFHGKARRAGSVPTQACTFRLAAALALFRGRVLRQSGQPDRRTGEGHFDLPAPGRATSRSNGVGAVAELRRSQMSWRVGRLADQSIHLASSRPVRDRCPPVAST